MDARKVLSKFEQTCGAWQAALERHGDDFFERDVGEGAWTLGQVCDHVTRASELFLDGAESLAGGDGEERGGNFMAWFMFGVGSLPPVRFKVPPNLPEPFRTLASPETLPKEEAAQRFANVARRTRELCDTVAAAPKKLRSQHPAGGWWITTLHWYQFSEMHMRHHLRQLKRIEKKLA